MLKSEIKIENHVDENEILLFYSELKFQPNF